MSLINQMLRDLEARGAKGPGRPDKPRTARPRGSRKAAGRPILLGILMIAAVGYALLEYEVLPWPPLDGVPGASPTNATKGPTPADDGDTGSASPEPTAPRSAAPPVAKAAAGDRPSSGTNAAKAADTPRRSVAAAPGDQSASPAQPGPSEAPEDHSADEQAAGQDGTASMAPPPSSDGAQATGYALQLGTFSDAGKPEAFIATLPEPVRDEVYLYETADGYRTVRYGFAPRTAGLNTAMELLRAHGLDPVVVESNPAGGTRTRAPAEEPPRKPPEEAPAKAAKDEPKTTNTRPSAKMQKRPHQPGPAERAAHQLQEARGLVEKGNLPAAEQRLRRAVELDPEQAAARSLLAQVLLRRGRAVEAKALLHTALKRHPDRLIDRELLARIRAREGDVTAAVEVLEAGLGDAGGDPDYLALLAALYQRLGRYVDSAGTYRAALARRPSAGVWWMGLGISLEGAQKDREAVKAYRRALGKTSEPELEAYVQGRLRRLGASTE